MDDPLQGLAIAGLPLQSFRRCKPAINSPSPSPRGVPTISILLKDQQQYQAYRHEQSFYPLFRFVTWSDPTGTTLKAAVAVDRHWKRSISKIKKTIAQQQKK
jgi:hypothetical protein